MKIRKGAALALVAGSLLATAGAALAVNVSSTNTLSSATPSAGKNVTMTGTYVPGVDPLNPDAFCEGAGRTVTGTAKKGATTLTLAPTTTTSAGPSYTYSWTATNALLVVDGKYQIKTIVSGQITAEYDSTHVCLDAESGPINNVTIQA